MKKILSVCIAIVLIITAMPLGTFNFIVRAATTADGLSYEIADGVVTITEYDWSASEVYIPEEIGGYPVVAISDGAFTYGGDFPFGYYGVEMLHIPSTVKTIEGLDDYYSCDFTIKGFDVDTNNLYFSSLDGVLYNKDKTILLKYPSRKKGAFSAPQGLKSIKYTAFGECYYVSDISLPDSCVGFSSGTLYDTEFYQNSDNWENGVLYVGNHLVKAEKDIEDGYEIKSSTVSVLQSAFSECENLTAIALPQSVYYVGSDAFYGCYNLNNITLGDNVTSIGYSAFVDTAYYDNSENWIDNVLYIGNYLIRAEISGTYEVKSSTLLIADEAFGDCYELEGIGLPEGLKYIGNSAFYGCESLKELNIPKTVVNIGEDAFEWCYGLEEINVADDNVYYSSSDDGYLYNKSKTILIKVPENTEKCYYRVPKTVERIEDRAIYGSNLQIIIFPDKNIEIGELALCHSIEILYIPKELTTLNENNFLNQYVQHILYGGDEEDWEASGYSEFEEFSSASICFSASADDFILTHKAAPECGGYDYEDYKCTKCNEEFRYNYKYKMHNMVLTEEFEAGCIIGRCEKYECTDCDAWEYLDDRNGTGHNFENQVCTKCGVEEGWEYLLSNPNGTGQTGVVVVDYEGDNPTPTVPETIEGYPVDCVAHTAFSYNNNVVSVTVPNNVTSIVYSAFRNSTSLASVALPSTVKTIRYSTFYNSNNLNHIFYDGTEEEWNKVEKQTYNEPLENATVHFNSSGEEVEVEVITPQTCTVGGKYKLTCKICNEVFYSETSPLGHKKGELVGEDTLTCKTPSNLLYDCARCDYVIKEPTANFKEHIFEDGSCTECGVLQEDCIESKHNYLSYESETWNINKPGAKEIRITFASEFDCHRLRIYDKDDNFIASGNEYKNLAGKTIVVPGDIAKLEIEYNERNEYYGFKIQYLEAIYSIAGDINADEGTNLIDLVVLAQYMAGWENLEVNESALDVNGDSIIDLNDVNHLARYLAGWDVVLN